MIGSQKSTIRKIVIPRGENGTANDTWILDTPTGIIDKIPGAGYRTNDSGCFATSVNKWYLKLTTAANQIAVFNSNLTWITTIVVGGTMESVNYDSGTDRVYCGYWAGGSSHLVVINPNTDTVVSDFVVVDPIGGNFEQQFHSPGRIFALSQDAGWNEVIRCYDITGGVPVFVGQIAYEPTVFLNNYYGAYAPATNRIWFPMWDSVDGGELWAIDPDTAAITNIVVFAPLDDPSDIIYNPGTGAIIVHGADDELSIFNPISRSIVCTLNVPVNNTGLAPGVDCLNGHIYYNEIAFYTLHLFH